MRKYYVILRGKFLSSEEKEIMVNTIFIKKAPSDGLEVALVTMNTKGGNIIIPFRVDDSFSKSMVKSTALAIMNNWTRIRGIIVLFKENYRLVCHA